MRINLLNYNYKRGRKQRKVKVKKMMYLVEKNYDLKTKRVFDNIDEAIASANEWFNDYPNDYINVCELNPSMKTVYECGTRK